jgi:vitamin B12 transporter
LLNAYAEYKWKSYVKIFIDAQNITNQRFFDIRGYNAVPVMINGGVTIEL